jgi:plasmid stabilization system protein ParE
VARLEVSDFAESDLADIYNAILSQMVRRSRSASCNVWESAIDRLRDFPESGRTCVRLTGKSLRVLPVERWIVVYRFDGETDMVLRVVDAARELSQVRLEET